MNKTKETELQDMFSKLMVLSEKQKPSTEDLENAFNLFNKIKTLFSAIGASFSNSPDERSHIANFVLASENNICYSIDSKEALWAFITDYWY